MIILYIYIFLRLKISHIKNGLVAMCYTSMYIYAVPIKAIFLQYYLLCTSPHTVCKSITDHKVAVLYISRPNHVWEFSEDPLGWFPNVLDYLWGAWSISHMYFGFLKERVRHIWWMSELLPQWTLYLVVISFCIQFNSFHNFVALYFDLG